MHCWTWVKRFLASHSTLQGVTEAAFITTSTKQTISNNESINSTTRTHHQRRNQPRHNGSVNVHFLHLHNLPLLALSKTTTARCKPTSRRTWSLFLFVTAFLWIALVGAWVIGLNFWITYFSFISILQRNDWLVGEIMC